MQLWKMCKIVLHFFISLNKLISHQNWFRDDFHLGSFIIVLAFFLTTYSNTIDFSPAMVQQCQDYFYNNGVLPFHQKSQLFLQCIAIFYGMNVDKKWVFLDHLPTSSCKRPHSIKLPYFLKECPGTLNFRVSPDGETIQGRNHLKKDIN